MQEDKKIIEIKASLDNLSKQIKATIEAGNDKDSPINKAMDQMYAMVNSLYTYVDYLDRDNRKRIHSISDMITKHMYQGHLPEIKGAGKMEHCLKVLGLDSDYNVSKPTIYASTQNGFTIQAEIT